MSDLNIAASGLLADSALLDAASNNLANINTPGYAREQVNLSPWVSGAMFQSGQGVMIQSVTELTDAVYAAANVSAQGLQGGANQASQVMSSIEAIFPEPNGNGIAAQLSTFWSDLSKLAGTPNQPGAQQVVAADAQTLANTFNSTSTQLSQLATSLQSEVGTGSGGAGTLAQANSLLQQVATLNQGIVAGTAANQNVNALIDQRRAAVDTLAGLLGVTTSPDASGAETVYLGGVQLVSGNVAQTLSSTGSAANANLAIVIASGAQVTAGGSVGANITAVNTVLPAYQSQLSGTANALATDMNTLQANGMDANGDPGSAIAGAYGGTILPNIFVDQGSSSTYTAAPNAAATITVSAAFLANPSLIATASAPGPGNSNAIGTPTLDGTNAQAMAALANSQTGPDALYQSMIGALGTQSAGATNAATAAGNLATTASNNVATVSGVNQNQEEVNILSAQNAFQAASKVIDAINTAYQSLLAAV